MNPYPFRANVTEVRHVEGGETILGLLFAAFPGSPPSGLTIYDVSWARMNRDPEPISAALPAAAQAVCREYYRSISPITSGFLRYLDHILTYPYAMQRLAVQPLTSTGKFDERNPRAIRA